ncbi:hypothetical protein Pcinc_016405 [Petrolisthes cinctipes]|uniref:Adenosine deaminase n=1 Tax=Petrolisthes cinctipes TaxID=88211 RepID=A0AAE1FR73_PETCI|nr:hypothetical protein Pcinc_016405 [Petrolisthes cinctipes]
MLLQPPLKDSPKCRVELHVHLDGAVRHETIWEVMRHKGLQLPGMGSLADLKEALRVQEPSNLHSFLEPVQLYLPALRGDLAVIERISYEFVGDQAMQSVAYCEVRFAPHLLLDPKPVAGMEENGIEGKKTAVTADQVLEAVLKGLVRGEEEFDTKARVILCCIKGLEDIAWDVLRLCEEYRDKGVVGIDVAGYEGVPDKLRAANEVYRAVFAAAREKGIHRTVHAGECEGPESVKEAVEMLGAERIGHGYRVIEDEDVYQMCLREDIHFEVCPHSSYLTGTVKSLTTESKRHPVLRFTEDGASYSINTDDPSLTHTRLRDEYHLLSSWGFNEASLARANFQAALHSFLPLDEKKTLLDQLKVAYGVVEYSPPQNSTTPSPSPSSSSSTPQPLKPSVTFGTWAERA